MTNFLISIKTFNNYFVLFPKTVMISNQMDILSDGVCSFYSFRLVPSMDVMILVHVGTISAVSYEMR